MKKQSFDDLMESYNNALAESGITCSARLAKLQRSTVIVRRHEAVGKRELDDAIIADYMCEISDRLDAGDIGQDYANTMRRETERFVLYAKTGEVRLPNPLLGARVTLSFDFQQIAAGFLESDSARIGTGGTPISPNTLNDIRWIAHKYFEWLTEQGFNDMRKVGAEQIQRFLLHDTRPLSRTAFP